MLEQTLHGAGRWMDVPTRLISRHLVTITVRDEAAKIDLNGITILSHLATQS